MATAKKSISKKASIEPSNTGNPVDKEDCDCLIINDRHYAGCPNAPKMCASGVWPPAV